jgi:integrase
MYRWRTAWYHRRPDRRAAHCIDFYDASGTRRRRCYPSKSAALRAKQLIEQALNTWLTPPTVKTWAELLVEYELHLSEVGPKHAADVARTLDRFSQLCGRVSSNAITPTLVENYFERRRSGRTGRTPPAEDPTGNATRPLVPPAPATLSREYRALHAFGAWAATRKYCPENPVAAVRPPRLVRKLKHAPTDREWLRLLEILPDADVDDAQAWHLLILLAIATGLRQSVLLSVYTTPPTPTAERDHARRGVPWAWIELGGADVEHVGLLHAYSPKTRKESLHGLPAEVNDRLALRLAALPPGTERLWPWASWQKRAWGRITHAAGSPGMTFHSLRAAAGTRAAERRAAAAGAAALDHSSPTVFSEHYQDLVRVQRALARQLAFPPLPPLPDYPAAAATSRRARAPTAHSGCPGRAGADTRA